MSTLQTVFFVLAAGLILFWFVLALREPRTDSASVIAVLRYGSLVRMLALLLALAPPTVMAYVVAAFAWRSPQHLALAGSAFFLSSLVAGLFHIEATRLRIVLDEDGITRISPWTGRTSIRWGDISTIRYSTINRWFAATGMGKTIRVSIHLANMRVFVDTVRRKVAAERFAAAAPVMARIT